MSRIADLIAQHCPHGVRYRRLDSVARRNKGTSITAGQMRTLQRLDGAVRVFAAGNTVVDVAEGSVPASSVIRDPSIIVKSRGIIGFAFCDRPFTHKNELWSYTVLDADVDSRFVYYYLLTCSAALQAHARATSVKLPQLSVADTDSLKIPVPPMVVQREIVAILEKMERLEAELEAELEARRIQYAHYRDSLLTFERERASGGQD